MRFLLAFAPQVSALRKEMDSCFRRNDMVLRNSFCGWRVAGNLGGWRVAAAFGVCGEIVACRPPLNSFLPAVIPAKAGIPCR
ncbi:MAG: hypothetical protein ACR2P5_07710 [Gammaproteobacteria bacterium]